MSQQGLTQPLKGMTVDPPPPSSGDRDRSQVEEALHEAASAQSEFWIAQRALELAVEEFLGLGEDAVEIDDGRDLSTWEANALIAEFTPEGGAR